MCGIVGVLARSCQVDRAALERASAALASRGPDAAGNWTADDGSVALAHRRLSIIGIENGRQPIESEDGRTVVAVNGEFYEHARIRRELEARGHRFRTDADSEIAVHLYEEHGLGFLEHLRGEFALVLWDARLERLVAARDRFGIKPLVWHDDGRTIWIASQAKALFTAGVAARWDEEALFSSTSLQYVPTDRTLFHGVHQLAAGHYLVAENGRLRTGEYWDLDYPPAGDEHFDRARTTELVDEFADRFETAVRLRLDSEAPLAFHLSGGLDSSAVLGVARRHLGGPQKAFTVHFDHHDYDELDVARQTASYLDVDLEPVCVSRRDLVDTLPEAACASEGLAVNGHLSAKYLLNRAVGRAGYKVVLTGEGADELVAGYPHLRVDLFRHEGSQHRVAALAAANTASRGIMLAHGSSLPLSAVAARLGFVPAFLEAKGTLGQRLAGVLSDEFRGRFAGRDAYAELLDRSNVASQLAGRHVVHQSLYLWSKTALSQYILRTLGDGTEMAHSVEGRVPFLDHRLFEFVRQLPIGLAIRAGVEKYILREATRTSLTDTVYRRRKHPFVAPPVTADSGVRGHLREVLVDADFQSQPAFDRGRVLALVDSLDKLPPADQAAADATLFTVLSVLAIGQGFGL